jgi:hypothetical protein
VFGDESSFGNETHIAISAPVRGVTETELESLKSRLLRDKLTAGSDGVVAVPLRRAANEAAALAWLTHFPLLVFPVLFEEKAIELHLQLDKQARVRSRSQGLVFS